MNIYEELVERIYVDDAAKEREAKARELAVLMERRESFLAIVEAVTKQSREAWPKPQLIEETDEMTMHWSLVIDRVMEFQWKSSEEAVIARLLPSICSAKCMDYVGSPEDLETLIRRHLSFGRKHQPAKKEYRDGTNTSN